MLDELHHLVDRAATLVRDLNVDALTGTEARAGVEAFVRLERLVAAGRLLCAGRLAETGAWVGDGSFRDPEGFMASVSGTSVGAARAALNTAHRIKHQPAVAAALRDGTLSTAQADTVSAAVDADPTTADTLVEFARTAGYRGLKHECDRVSAAAQSRDTERANYERITRERSLRHHRNRDGSGRIEIRGPLDRTAQIMASLEPLERELFETNRAGHHLVHPDAVAFDALVALTQPDTPVAATKTRGTRPLGMVVVHVSHTAYQRGWTEPGEICELESHGPVPVGVARRISSDAILKAVVTNSVDITRVAHLGRTIPTHLRTAIETRDRTCVIEGCDIDRHLEIDHNIPIAVGGPTSLDNLARLCHHHHRHKTLHDLHRTGPPGHQHLTNPNETITRSEYARAGPGP